MIWESTILMAAVDVIAIAVAVGLAFVLRRYRSEVRRLKLMPAVLAIFAGLAVFALLYATDLFIMIGLPQLVGHERAMAIMTELHLDWAWVVALIVLGSIGGGLAYLLTRLVPRAASNLDELESSRRREAVDRKQVEKELHSREKWFRAVFDQAVQLVALMTPEGELLELNRIALEYEGLESGEIRGQSFWELPSMARSQELRTQMRRAVERAAAGELVTFEAAGFSSGDGGSRTLQVSLGPIQVEAGKVVSVIAAGFDVTERKLAEKELKESEEKLRRIFESMQDGYLVSDLAGKVLLANPAAARLLGYELDELQTLNLPRDIYAEAGRREELEAALERQNQIKEFEIEFKRKDGQTITAESSVHFVMNDEGEPVAIEGLFRDVTERKEREEELRRYRGHLEELVEERSAELRVAKEQADAANLAKSTFLANMSHEIRTPMNAVLGFTQLLDRDPSLAEHHRQQVQTIERAGEQLLALIDDVLEMSKIEAGRVSLVTTTFDLHALLENQAAMFRARTDAKGLDLHLERGDRVPRRVGADQGKLRQILANLLGNAVKFTEEGTIMLRVDAEPGEEDACRLVIEVEDTGVGIAEDELDSVFGEFLQAKSGVRSGRGTGLGIPISKRYAELMGGELTVTSEPGKGSVFRLEILVEEREAADVEASVSAPRVEGLAPGQERRKLLVVDDVENNREVAARLLKAAGFEVREAADGEEALAVFDAWRPDLILMDVRMPKMDGYEATRRIKATGRGRRTPIIALTSSAFEEQRSKVLASGADDFQRKPFRADDLLRKIGQQLELEYRYEEAPGRGDAAVALTREALAELPDELTANMREAVDRGDIDQLYQLIDRAADHDADVARALRSLADRFDYASLGELW